MDSTRRSWRGWATPSESAAGRPAPRAARRRGLHLRVGMGALLAVALAAVACGGGPGGAPSGGTRGSPGGGTSGGEATASGGAVEASTDAVVAGPDTNGPEAVCDAFNRREAARAAEPPGRCPHCPCFCDPVRGVVCAPCARCVEALSPEPGPLEPGPRP